MTRMRIYTVHINPSMAYPYEAAEFVAEGFNWKAFLFTSLWALFNRLWLAAFLLIAYNLVMISLLYSETFSSASAGIIDTGGHLLIGFQANEWLRAKLARRGYLTADITSGDSELGAEQRFFDRHIPAFKAA